MIYIAGDLHGEIEIHKLNSNNFPEGKNLTKEDYVIVCGDFGLVWNNSDTELYWRKWLTEKPWTTLFVDGNHDCVSKDTEILTEFGWKNIQEIYDNDIYKIANFDIATKQIYFDYPLNKIKKFKEKLIEISGKNTYQKISFNHDLIIDNEKIKAIDILQKNIKEHQFIFKGLGNQSSIDIPDNYIRLLTWVITDGTIVDNSKYMPNSKKIRVQFKLSKKRKIKSLCLLLKEMNFKFTLKKSTKSKTNKLQPYYVRIYGNYSKDIFNKLGGIKKIPKEWRNFNEHQIKIFLETLVITDGTSIHGDKGIRWNTTAKEDVDIIQEACIKNNINFIYSVKENASGFKKGCLLQYHCYIHPDKKTIKKVNIDIIDYNDYTYCFTMPKGTLITRLNGKVVFTGNCFPLLNQYSIEDWNGGKVHKITDSIIHLMRGQIFTINNKKFFTFGGAESHDKQHRIEHVSWWKEEMPNYSEMEEGITNLKTHDFSVDYILSHDCSSQVLWEIDICRNFTDDALNKYFEHLKSYFVLQYKKWFFGHYHIDGVFNKGKDICLYDKIIKL